jgi:23S rRNA (adenine2503-C2)-methyltransferase
MYLADAAGRYGNIVFMGMGEPLCNLEAVLPSLDALTDERRFAIGSRRITVSTCGIPRGIERLSRSPARPNLALSLNAPWNELRSEIMPVSRKYSLEDVVEACKAYRQRTGRRIMLEYVLLKDVNCSRECAKGVATLSEDLDAMVNLIVYNPATSLNYEEPANRQVAEFRRILEGRGVVVTQRYKRGREISAGCGQLGGECCQETRK